MKEEIEKMYVQALIDDLPPNVFADQVLRLFSVSSRFYQIDFGNHLRCKLKIADGKIEVEGAINGWGDGVPLDEVVIFYCL